MIILSKYFFKSITLNTSKNKTGNIYTSFKDKILGVKSFEILLNTESSCRNICL